MNVQNLELEAIVAQMRKRLGEERKAAAEFVVLLGEILRREAFRELGFGSPWDLCRQGFGLCEGSTHRRIRAARIVTRYPQATEMLRDGRLCLTTLALLADVLCDQNADQLLVRAQGRSKREVEEMVASMRPQPPVRAMVRRVPSPPPAVSNESLRFEAPLRKPAHIEPVADARYLVRLEVSRSFKEKLERARDLLSHSVPDGATEAVLEAALDCLIEKLEKRRSGSPRASAGDVSPRPARDAKGRRTKIPAAIRHAVAERDGDKCAWPRPGGGVCGSSYQVQFAHKLAVGLGGEHSLGGIWQLCAAHNRLDAERVFGRELMATFRRKPHSASGVNEVQISQTWLDWVSR